MENKEHDTINTTEKQTNKHMHVNEFVYDTTNMIHYNNVFQGQPLAYLKKKFSKASTNTTLEK